MISIYDNFPTFATNVFNYLLKSPEVMLPLIGVFFLYFGYYSTKYKPIRTEKLHLYLSGFQFLSTYIGIQIIIIYIFSRYISITPLNVVYWLSVLFLFTLLIYLLGKIKHKALLKFGIIVTFFVVVIVTYFFKVPSVIWNYVLEPENIKLITILLILYHATMVILSAATKENMNHNSYNYKDFYSKTTKMRLSQYSVFSYFLRVTQQDWYTLFFGKSKIGNNEKKLSEKSADKSSNENEMSNTSKAFDEIALDRLRQKYSPKQLKQAGIGLQDLLFQSETWFNSLLIVTFFYVTFTYNEISLPFGLLLTIYLFFALTSIAVEYSIYTNGFLLIELYPKIGEPFRCRLMELNEKLITVLRKGDKENKDFNPLEHYPLNEIAKIRYVSRGEMLDEL